MAVTKKLPRSPTNNILLTLKSFIMALKYVFSSTTLISAFGKRFKICVCGESTIKIKR